jgi:multidrug resistance protein, MATE family
MGNFGSIAHLGAIGLGSAIFNFLYWNFAFLRMSTVGLTAQEYGKDNKKEIATILGRAMLVAMLGASLLLIFQKPIGNLAFQIIKGNEDVEAYARSYYSIRIWAAPATIGLSALTGWFIGVQNAKAPMITAIVVNLVNIGLSYLFVAILGKSSDGVALGTVIGQYSGFTIAIIILFTKYRSYIKLIEIKLILNIRAYKKFFLVNLDIFIRTLAIILVLTWYNISSAEKGEIILGVNVIFLQLVYAFSYFSDGFANAAEALVGKYYGAKNIIQLKKVVKHLFYWGFGIAVMFTLIYIFAWEQIVSLFSKDENIIPYAAEYIGWIWAIPIVSILTFIWDGIFLGATATAVQRNTTFVAALLFFATYKLLENTYGNHALLFAQLVFFGMRGILQSIFYKSAILKKILKPEETV